LLEEVTAAVSVPGAVGTALQVPPVTVSATAVLGTVPPGLVTLTLKSAPLSVTTVAGVVYVALVAPMIALPFFSHW
jgi:hypothetical protein